ncbi:MAG: sel1 repeat family protein [Synergistaceae bacterium]|nr:sel1 repeat family protein [Synergistaceae bacterium]
MVNLRKDTYSHDSNKQRYSTVKKIFVCMVCLVLMTIFTGTVEWVVGKFLDDTSSYVAIKSFYNGIKAKILGTGNNESQDISEIITPDPLENYRTLAEQGNADAQNNLGLAYYNGEIVSRDLSESLKWFTKAAEQNHADSQFILGDMYYNGEGVAQNYSEAIKWLTNAAE